MNSVRKFFKSIKRRSTEECGGYGRVDRRKRWPPYSDIEPFEHINLVDYLKSMTKKDRPTNLGDIELLFFPEIYDLHQLPYPVFYQNTVTDEKIRHMIDDFIYKYTFRRKIYPMMQFLNSYNFVEMYLENMDLLYQYIPSQLFDCTSLRVLSFRNNSLTALPPRIGRLHSLHTLVLSNNMLPVEGIPFTLIFCTKLRKLYIDNNELNAIPAFLRRFKRFSDFQCLCNHSLAFEWVFKLCHKRQRVQMVRPLNRNREQLGTVDHVRRLEDFAAANVLRNCDDVIVDDFQTLLFYYTCRRLCGYCYSPIDSTKQSYVVYALDYGLRQKHWLPMAYTVCSSECACNLSSRLPSDEAVCMNIFMSENYGFNYI